ncbi:MAG: hypothetical protein EAZ34_02780 [Polaromonas sp.]|nr:MAG: hypothetical protein EAZ34_02780 [Polaromonas sp.]
MTDLVNKVFRFIFKLILALFGLVFVLSLLAATAVIVVLSLLKALITGKKPPIAMIFNRFRSYSPKGVWPGRAGSGAKNSPPRAGDVVDVDVREIRHDK